MTAEMGRGLEAVPAERANPSEQLLAGFINGVANHERKLALAAIVLAHPEREFSGADGSYELEQRQGKPLAWPSQDATGKQYFEQSLEPVGAVVKISKRDESGRIVPAFVAEPSGRQLRLALCGFLMDWSLRYPDLSVQQVYGGTNSTTEVRVPWVRHKMYAGLLLNGGVQSVAGLEAVMDDVGYSRPLSSISIQVRSLERLGILQKITKHRGYNPLVEIIGTELVNHNFEMISTETRAIYDAMRQEGIGTQILASDLIDIAKALDPTADERRLKGILNDAANPTSHAIPGLQLVDSGGLKHNEFSRVKISPDHLPAITALVLGIETLFSGRNVEHYQTVAKQIIDDPAAINALFAKSRAASPTAKRERRPELINQTAEVIRALGEATLVDIVESLAETTGRNISITLARDITKHLLATGAFTRAKVRQLNVTRQNYVYKPLAEDLPTDQN
ncbi:MAG TPA: hypothetical protein VHB51_04145 [Candidatus Saccharimonadales bacterium]|nr:hypothetical protein [Candidatus Saccharimonadales bacterium]